MIFFDSPMAQKVTEVFEDYTDYMNKEINTDILSFDPFHYPGLTYVKNFRESKLIWENVGPKIIIAGSGMMSGGRILSHAQNYLGMESTRLLFVGYQAEETLGRQILEGERRVTIGEMEIEIKASVNQIESFSSHADQPRLINWLKNIKGLKNIFLVHGEDGARAEFSKKISEELGSKNVFIPKINEEIEIS